MNLEKPNLTWNKNKDYQNHLYQNFPNPFNPTTVIKYELDKPGNVSLKIFDMLGREINTLVNEIQDEGFHFAVWNGKNSNGYKVSSGIYIYSLISESGAVSKKLVLLK